MDVDYYNSIKGACDYSQGQDDQYKVTIYLKNESGRKIKSDLSYAPLVRIEAPAGECAQYNEFVDYNYVFL